MKNKSFVFDSNISVEKVKKTVKRVLRNGRFFLALSIPPTIFVSNIEYNHTKKRLIISANEGHDKLLKLIKIDQIIRSTDDKLDNMSIHSEKNYYKKRRVITDNFRKKMPIGKEVLKLFQLENEILLKTPNAKKEKFIEIIDLRPSDFFLLARTASELFPTKLDKKTFESSFKFYQEYQRIRDILDDIISIEEDTINGNYNLVIYCKKNNIPYSFIQKVIRKKFDNLKKLKKEIRNHPYESAFAQTIQFWYKIYQLMFVPLLKKYYSNKISFEELYAIVK